MPPRARCIRCGLPLDTEKSSEQYCPECSVRVKKSNPNPELDQPERSDEEKDETPD
jgi:hypothetical protein